MAKFEKGSCKRVLFLKLLNVAFDKNHNVDDRLGLGTSPRPKRAYDFMRILLFQLSFWKMHSEPEEVPGLLHIHTHTLCSSCKQWKVYNDPQNQFMNLELKSAPEVTIVAEWKNTICILQESCVSPMNIYYWESLWWMEILNDMHRFLHRRLLNIKCNITRQ